MKKSLVLSLAAFFGGFCASFAVGATEFYVSLSGNDAAAGTKSAPFKTITQAQKAVRAVNSDMSGDITVYLREGTYQLASTIRFTNADGGTNGHYVNYQAYGDETVVITGGQPINGWELCDEANNIWCAKGVDARFRQLYINGKKAIRARHPNIDNAGDHNFNRLAKVDSAGRAFDVYTDQIKNLKDVKRAEIHLMVAWADQVLRLDEVQNNGSVSKLVPQDPERSRLFKRKYPMLGTAFMSDPPKQQVYYLENDYNLMDSEGEWFLDEDKNILYYKGRPGESMATANVVVPNLETLIEIRGESTKNKLQNLRIKGIAFEHTNYMRPSKEGFLNLQAGQFAVFVENRGNLNSNEFMLWHPNAGIMVSNTSRLAIEDNIFANMAGTGLDLESGTNDSRIVGNVFKEIGGSGISVGKFAPDSLTEIHKGYNPSDKDEISTRDTIKYNLVTNVTNEIQGAVGIAAGYPRYVVIDNNEVSYTNYSGISVGFGWTKSETAMTNNHINRNNIHHISSLLCDSGPIYTLSNQGTGSEIHYNYLHDFSGSKWADYWILPIYLDEGSSGFTVEHNSYKNAPNGVGSNQPGYFTETDNKSFSQETADKSGLQGEYKAIANKSVPEPNFGDGIAQEPFKAVMALPGKVQFEDFDVGGQGISYSDNDIENQGSAYRDEGVDVVGLNCAESADEPASSTACEGYAVGYTAAGEWMEYSVNVTVESEFMFRARVASGLEHSGFQIFVDGTAVSDTIEIPQGEDWDTYTEIEGKISRVEKGEHVIRVKVTGSYANLDWIAFAESEDKLDDVASIRDVVRGDVQFRFDESDSRVQFFDMKGHRVNKAHPLKPGVYLVKGPTGSYLKRVEKR